MNAMRLTPRLTPIEFAVYQTIRFKDCFVTATEIADTHLRHEDKILSVSKIKSVLNRLEGKKAVKKQRDLSKSKAKWRYAVNDNG